MINLGIIGLGFVGGAVHNAFSTSDATLCVVDPAHSDVTIQQLVSQENPDVVFVCVPTPSTKTGKVNDSTVRDVLRDLTVFGYTGIVVIKSTITPDSLSAICADFNLRIVYNPEFLTEANADFDFMNPAMQVLGGDWHDCSMVEQIYVNHSRVKTVPTFKTDIITASLIKYTINSWLATKVIFMNEIHKLHAQSGAESTWQQFISMLQCDSRVGNSHMQVPGPDGNFGFGGHCFPKDTQAFLKYAITHGTYLSVLDQAVQQNILIHNKK
jgi:nucleotide sugar dehydrogenase